MAWEKDHHRLDRRRLKRVSVSPEEIGLCGCWQVIAVRRERGRTHAPSAKSRCRQMTFAVALAALGR